jgi:hypothetical protein
MKIEINETLKKLKTIFLNIVKQLTIYSIIGLTCASSFFIGYYYRKMFIDKNGSVREIKKIDRQDVTLAVDEYNNLMVIDKKTGDYTIYSDSVARTIFNIYAKNIAKQHY